MANLRRVGSIARVSSFYETEPVEFTDQDWFLNCVVAIETELSPDLLMAALLEVEKAMGRERTIRKGPRTIDLDILLFGESVLSSPGLTIPHPEMAHRRFVLQPLAEIAPDAWHPVLKKTARHLLDELPVGQEVRRVPEEKSDAC